MSAPSDSKFNHSPRLMKNTQIIIENYYISSQEQKPTDFCREEIPRGRLIEGYEYQMNYHKVEKKVLNNTYLSYN